MVILDRRDDKIKRQNISSFLCWLLCLLLFSFATLSFSSDLLFSTFLGGSINEAAQAIAVDANGNIYVAGRTASINFPTTTGAFDTTNTGVFVTKLNPTGSALIYSTFIGNAGSIQAIAVDVNGNSYITGDSGGIIPTTLGAFDTTFASGKSYVIKLNSSGSNLVYATYLGDTTGSTYGSAITIDASGNAYVTGGTTDPRFPTTASAYDTSFNGGLFDAFITKINSSGTGLVYSTFLGGSTDNDHGQGIKVDINGNAYVVGYTHSNDFPTTIGAYDDTFNGGAFDVFITKLNPSGSSLVYSTFIGGSGDDDGQDIAIDDNGNVYITGELTSSDFPVTPDSFDTTFNGVRDAFITKLNQTGSNLIFSTYFGGIGTDYATSIAIDANGNAYITGFTDSPTGFFPITPGAYNETYSGNVDAFVAKTNSLGSQILYSTYIGGSQSDYSYGGVSLDGGGNVVIAGVTQSSDFPIISGAYDISYNGSEDVFVSKLKVSDLPPPNTVFGTNMTWSAFAAEPVNTIIGNYTYGHTDLLIPGSGMGLNFTRSYNSQDTTLGPLGNGWTNTYNLQLANSGDTILQIRWDDGHVEYYNKLTTGYFTPQFGGVFNDITKSNVSTYVLNRPDKSQYSFSSSGQITSIVDKSNNIITCLYDSFGNLSTVSDSAGRLIQFSYTSSRISTITDPLSRTISFTYDGNTNLATVNDPRGGRDTYTYDASHEITQITDAKGNIKVKNVYDSLSRVTSQENGRGFITTFTYDTVIQVTSIKDPKGNTTLHYYDSFLRLIKETDAKGKSVQYGYDTKNSRTRITDKRGLITQFPANSNGFPVSKVDPLGKSVIIDYSTTNNNPLSRKDSLGHTTLYSYDSIGNLNVLTNPRGNNSQIFYDSFGQATASVNGRGNKTFNAYDSYGNLTSVKSAVGTIRIFYYDIISRITSISDPRGNSFFFSYDANNNLISTIDAQGGVVSYAYDSNNNRTSVTDQNGKTTQYSYDSNNNLIRITNPLGGTITYAYDSNDNLSTGTDPLGRVVQYSYDSNNQLIQTKDTLGNTSQIDYDENGNQIKFTDPIGNITQYVYDSANRISSIIDPLNRTISYTYDSADRVIKITDAKGLNTFYAYDANDNLTSVTDSQGNVASFVYDSSDNRTSVTDPKGNIAQFQYDAANRLIRTIDPLGNKTDYAYDSASNITTITNSKGFISQFFYDSLSRQTEIRDPLGNKQQYAFDSIGRITRITDARGHSLNYEYDDLGRLIGVTDAVSGHWTYAHDSVGNLLSITDALSHIPTFSYDSLNRLSLDKDAMGFQNSYSYDSNSNLLQLTDANGHLISFQYDFANRLTQITYPGSSTITYTYDSNNNVTAVTDTNGTENLIYDTLNRVSTVTDVFSKSISYLYDSLGSITALTYPTGSTVFYAYDSSKRLANVKDWLGGITAYSYDSNGNITRIDNPNSTYVIYLYDSADRLTTLINYKSDNFVIASYYISLDSVGNRTGIVKTEPVLPFQSTGTTNYSYDSADRILSESSTFYLFDSNGNLTTQFSSANTTFYYYDSKNELIKVVSNGTVTQYRYDSFGNRIETIYNGTTTRYILDGNGTLPSVLAEMDASGTITGYYVYGLGLTSLIKSDGTRYFYHFDPLGSVIALTNSSQTVTDAYTYDAFGRIANSFGSTNQPFRYVGGLGVQQDSNGLLFMRARYYNSQIARFLTKDPMDGDNQSPQSLDKYIYALNNAINNVDPSGLFSLGGIVSSVSHAVSSAVSSVSKAVTSTVSNVVKATTPIVNSTVNSITNTVNNVSKAVTSTVSHVSNAVTSSVSNVIKAATPVINNTVNSITNTVNSASNTITSAVSNTPISTINSYLDKGQTIYDLLDRAGIIPPIVNIASESFIPSIPGLFDFGFALDNNGNIVTTISGKFIDLICNADPLFCSPHYGPFYTSASLSSIPQGTDMPAKLSTSMTGIDIISFEGLGSNKVTELSTKYNNLINSIKVTNIGGGGNSTPIYFLSTNGQNTPIIGEVYQVRALSGAYAIYAK